MKRLTLTAVLCIAIVLLGAGAARAECEKRGDLLLCFDGRFAPHALPRDHNAPVTVRLTGSVKTANSARPPQLRSISVAINRHGRLDTRGLPTCFPAQLEQTSTRSAMARCRDALVGRGKFKANIDFPNDTFPVRGTMRAFNSRVHGRRVILLHIHGSKPVEATVVLTFRISHPRRGTFGTVLSTKIPKIAADLGYVTDISLVFGRRYRFDGKRRSFISASCSAPVGFPGALFDFARGSFTFANGQVLQPTLSRDCRVR